MKNKFYVYSCNLLYAFECKKCVFWTSTRSSGYYRPGILSLSVDLNDNLLYNFFWCWKINLRGLHLAATLEKISFQKNFINLLRNFFYWNWLVYLTLSSIVRFRVKKKKCKIVKTENCSFKFEGDISIDC